MIRDYATRLRSQLTAASIPHDSVASYGQSWKIDYPSGTTTQQKTTGDGIASSFDWSDAAQAAWEAAQNPEKDGIVKAAANAIATNDSFRAIASPSNAQVVAFLKEVARQNTAVIKRLIQLTG